jgi:hypothetical protein
MTAKRAKKAAGGTKVLEAKQKPEETVAAAKQAKPKRARKPKAAAQVNLEEENQYYVVIDYPQNGETVSGLHYALRIGASEVGYVEVSFDNGEWVPARNGAGYWWYDWGYFTPGTHKIAARLVGPEGKILKKSDVVTVEVV